MCQSAPSEVCLQKLRHMVNIPCSSLSDLSVLTCRRLWCWHLTLLKLSCYKSQRNKDLFRGSYLGMLFFPPLLRELTLGSLP